MEKDELLIKIFDFISGMFQKELISSRFLLAVMIIYGCIIEKIDIQVGIIVVGFYFGSNAIGKTVVEYVDKKKK